MTQTKMKPVWRLNTGVRPSDLSSFVLYEKATTIEKVQDYHFNHDEKWLIKNFIDIAAYQTTRTKKAKYERAECNLCFGEGLEITTNHKSGGLYYTDSSCPYCNGKGHTWEPIK